jgi:serine/threonine protein kinase/tetratricopeptide (TPR) repeat protein
MGQVFAATVAGRALGLSEGDRVALKVVHPHLLQTEGFFKRFMREASIGQSIQHDNVVRTYDCDQVFAGDRPHAFLVMEYVEGQTLSQLRNELDVVPEELCRHVAREICRGLSAIHEVGIVHRDLKPENVLITPDHVVKVMDLGVARLADEQMRLSQSGAFVGSVEYAAPEQFDGGDVDHRCDLHALGILLYELSCGQHPYRGDDFRGVMKRVCEAEPRRAGEINPQLSPFFEEVVHTLLAKSRDDRFASADELLGILGAGEDSEWWAERARALRATTKRPLRRIRIPRETAVYGRGKELEKLRRLFDLAHDGDGQVVLLEGEAGIGKSRLVDELISRLQADGEDLNFLFGSYPPGGAASAAGAFSTAFREQFGDEGTGAYLPDTPLLVPAFEAVLRGDSAPSGAEPLTQDSLVTCFVQASRVLASERPTIILIDDLHFAPEEARSLFSALAMALPGHRVLLIGTMRPGVEGDWRGNLQRFEYVTQMHVERLFPKDLIELLRDSFKSDALAATLSAQVAMKSDGNPFFAFEIIRGLREGQFITQKDDGTWVSTQIIDEIQIPSSVLDLVNARVADLSEDERNLLDVACCWGFEFDPVVVGEVLGMARIPLLRSLGQIERRHRLVRASGRRYVFDHHQVQEALYGSLSELLREEYHGALAEALEARTKAAEKDPDELDGALCVDLCEHYLMGARGEDALRYLPAAQAHLTKGYLHAQVVALTERALAVPDLLTGMERAKTLLRLASALDPMGRRARQEECAREAEKLADEANDDELRVKTAMSLGLVLYRTARHEEAAAVYRRAMDIAVARGDQRAEAAAVGNLGGVFQSLGRLAEAREHHERQLAISREIGDQRGEVSATGSLGNVLLGQGRLSEAQAHYERALRLSREIGDRRFEAISTGNLGTVLGSLGRWPEAREQTERAYALSREIGYRQGEAIAANNLGKVAYCLGRLSEAREHWERYLLLSREIGYRQGAVIAQSNLGLLLCELGEHAGGEEQLLTCLAECEEIGYRYLEASAHLSLGALRVGAGNLEAGRESFALARSVAREVGRAGVETLARCELALLPGGDSADAVSAFTEHEDRLAADDRREARLLLWRATGDRAHLEDARRLLDEAMADVPEEGHESMVTNLRVNREIMAAWRAESGGDDDAPPSESVTKAGLS